MWFITPSWKPLLIFSLLSRVKLPIRSHWTQPLPNCLLDIEQILIGQGANDTLNQRCSSCSSYLTEASCPVNKILMNLGLLWDFQVVWCLRETRSCERMLWSNCQNAGILEDAMKILLKAFDFWAWVALVSYLSTQLRSTEVSDFKISSAGWQVNLLLCMQRKVLGDYLIAILTKVSYVNNSPQI